jgi:hypothetical protein
VTTRTHRPVAAREVISASERLMDGLLAEEQDCFRRLDRGVREVGQAVTDRVRARAKSVGRAELVRSVDDLLVTRALAGPLLMPAVGDLLAVTRTRSLEVVARQLRACASTVDLHWSFLAAGGVEAARVEAAVLERHWYDRAVDEMVSAGGVVRTEMLIQYRKWAQFEEPVTGLLDRWVSPEDVRLPGAGMRGSVWLFLARMMVAARTASVALTNGVLLAGMRGWNVAQG